MASHSDLSPLTGWSSEGMALHSNRPRPISRTSASQFSSFKEKDALLHSTQAYGSPITQPAVSVRSVMGRRTSQDDAVAVQLNLMQGPDQKSAQQQQDPTGLAMECGQAASPTPMQTDSAAAVPMFHFAGVFDGHGGSAVSNHCANNMANILRSQLFNKLSGDATPVSRLHPNDSNPDSTSTSPAASSEIGDAVLQCITPSTDNGHCGSDRFQLVQELSEEQVTDALIQSFAICDAGIPAVSASEGGSTAVCALLTSDRVWVANCGDSRALIGRRGRAVISLSTDHKPERPDEAARIQAAGGLVFWNAGHRVMGVLNMSRAMGDMYLKQYGVIAVPEVVVVPRTEDDEFLLLASDGLWSSLSNEEAVALAAECIERAHKRGADRTAALRIAAQVLVKAALQQGSSDNISVVMVDLRKTPDEEPEHQMQAEVGHDITIPDAPAHQPSQPTSQPTTAISDSTEVDSVQQHNPVTNANNGSDFPAQTDAGALDIPRHSDQVVVPHTQTWTDATEPVVCCNPPTVTTSATLTGLSFGSVISVQRQPSHDMITTPAPDIAMSVSPSSGNVQELDAVLPDTASQDTAEPAIESMDTQADIPNTTSLITALDVSQETASAVATGNHVDVLRPAPVDLARVSAPAFVSGEVLSIPSPKGNRVFGRSHSSTKSRFSAAPGLPELSKLAQFRSCSMPRDVASSSNLSRECSPFPPSLDGLTVSPGKRSHSEPPEVEQPQHVPSPTKRSRMYQTAHGIIPHLTLATKLARTLSRSSHSPINSNPCLDKSIERLLVTVDSP